MTMARLAHDNDPAAPGPDPDRREVGAGVRGPGLRSPSDRFQLGTILRCAARAFALY